MDYAAQISGTVGIPEVPNFGSIGGDISFGDLPGGGGGIGGDIGFTDIPSFEFDSYNPDISNYYNTSVMNIVQGNTSEFSQYFDYSGDLTQSYTNPVASTFRQDLNPGGSLDFGGTTPILGPIGVTAGIIFSEHSLSVY